MFFLILFIMFKVIFSEDLDSYVCIAKCLKLEDAIQFALNLHRSSNSTHSVFVEDDGGDVSLRLTFVSE